MTANAQIRSVIERIIRLKEEQDALGEDIKEIYAEAKSNGFDKTALGRVVNHVRKRAKKGEAEMDEADAIFDLYLTAYEGQPSHAHTHAREERDLDGTGEVRPRVSAAAPPGSATKKSPATVSDDDMAIPAFMRRMA